MQDLLNHNVFKNINSFFYLSSTLTLFYFCTLKNILRGTLINVQCITDFYFICKEQIKKEEVLEIT